MGPSPILPRKGLIAPCPATPQVKKCTLQGRSAALRSTICLMDQLLSQNVMEDLLAASRNGMDGVAYVLEHRQPLIIAVKACLYDLASPGTAELSAAAACSLLLQALRVLRNACAGGPAAAEELVLRQGVVVLVGKLLSLVEAATLQLDWQLPLVGGQLLANAATASPACAAAVWEDTFPLQLNILGHINLGPVQSALSLCLLTCCRKVPGAAAALCSPAGSPIMAAVLFAQQQLQREGKHNDNLGLLVSYLCFQRGLLPALALSLTGATSRAASLNPAVLEASAEQADGNGFGSAAASIPGAATVAASPTLAHVVLLQELSHEAQAGLQLGNVGNEDAKGTGFADVETSLSFLVSLIQDLALLAKQGPLTEGQQQVLQDTLQLLRDIAATDDSPAEASSTFQQPTCPFALLQREGLLSLLLAMLKALGPIRSPQHPQQAGQGMASNGNGSIASGSAGSYTSGAVEQLSVAELAPALAGQAEQLPSEPPYFGYRSDILSVLANAAHGRPGVKAEVQALGGVELILAQCQMDRQSPLAREWALWGVRNLCEGNEAAQAAIRELQLCTAMETEETRQLGVKLELDQSSGRLRVVQRQPQQAGLQAEHGQQVQHPAQQY